MLKCRVSQETLHGQSRQLNEHIIRFIPMKEIREEILRSVSWKGIQVHVKRGCEEIKKE